MKKSIHDRKHYLENTIKNICDKYNLYLPSHDREKIHQILKETRKILPQINGDRKHMININFVLKKIFQMFGAQCDIIVTVVSDAET